MRRGSVTATASLDRERIVNTSVVVKEHQDKVVFLRRLVEGPANRSYGIQVARLAGLPRDGLFYGHQGEIVKNPAESRAERSGNAGGVTVSYFEWVQDFNRDQWSEEVVNSKLTAIMVRSFGEVVAMAEREVCDMRTAAYLLAVDRVATATALRGLYP